MRLDSEICNFADANTIFSCWLDLHETVTNLNTRTTTSILRVTVEKDTNLKDTSLSSNGLRTNELLQAKKIFAYVLILERPQKTATYINENKLSATDHIKLLGIEVDNKLSCSLYYVQQSTRKSVPFLD